MNPITTIILATTLVSTSVLAQNEGFVDPKAATPQTQSTSQGGFVSPTNNLTTAEKAKALNDNTWVTLRGNIEQRINDKDYIFRDESGTINIEIDQKRWNGQTVTPQDKVEIQGKVDKDKNVLEIDVKQLNKIN